MREFPQLVQLHRQQPDQVACMSLNIDYDGSGDGPPDSLRDRVFKFLQQQEATFQNVVCSDSDDALYKELDLASIPAVFVYDRQGTLRKRFDNDSSAYGDEGFSYAQHVVPFVQQLLAE